MIKFADMRNWLLGGAIAVVVLWGGNYALHQTPKAVENTSAETVNVDRLARGVVTFFSQTPKGVRAVGRGVSLGEGIILTAHSMLSKAEELHLRTDEARIPGEIAVLSEEPSVHAALLEKEGLKNPAVDWVPGERLNIDDEVWMLNGMNVELWRPARIVSIRSLPLGQSIYRVAGSFYAEDEGSLIVSSQGKPVGVLAGVVDGVDGAQVIPLSIAIGMIQKAKPVPFRTYMANKQLETFVQQSAAVPAAPKRIAKPNTSSCLIPLHRAVMRFYRGVDALVLSTVVIENERSVKLNLDNHPEILQSRQFFGQANAALRELSCADNELDEIRRVYLRAAEREYYGMQSFINMIEGGSKNRKTDLADIKQHLGAMLQEVTGLQSEGVRFANLAKGELAERGEQMVPLLDVSLMIEENQARLPKLDTPFWLSTAEAVPKVLAVANNANGAQNKLQTGDVIIGSTDGHTFKHLKDFYSYILQREAEEELGILVRRQDEEVAVTLKIQP